MRRAWVSWVRTWDVKDFAGWQRLQIWSGCWWRTTTSSSLRGMVIAMPRWHLAPSQTISTISTASSTQVLASFEMSNRSVVVVHTHLLTWFYFVLFNLLLDGLLGVKIMLTDQFCVCLLLCKQLLTEFWWDGWEFQDWQTRRQWQWKLVRAYQ